MVTRGRTVGLTASPTVFCDPLLNLIDKLFPLEMGPLVCLKRFGISPFEPRRAEFAANLIRSVVALGHVIEDKELERLALAIFRSRHGLRLAAVQVHAATAAAAVALLAPSLASAAAAAPAAAAIAAFAHPAFQRVLQCGGAPSAWVEVISHVQACSVPTCKGPGLKNAK